MRFDKLYEKKAHPEQSAVSSGVQELGTDQWMGTYKWSKDVAGHDGEKQHAPESPSGNDVYTDKPVVVGFSDADDKMTKAAMNGKVKQTVGSGSEEPKNVNAKSPLSKNEDVSKGLPDHLKKHFDKDGNPIKGSWKDGKWTPNKDPKYQVKDVTPKGYGPNENVSESSEIKVPTEDGITMQDIRLMAGEGKLTQKTIKQAIEVIRKQRKEKQTKLKEAQNIYHLNRTGFARGPRDSERHDLDVNRPTPQEWALKINGKVWSKDGKTVTFNSKEQALKVRQSLLAKRPDLEVGLVTRGGTTESKDDTDVGAQIADLIRKKNSASSPVARKNIDSQIAQLKRQRDKMNEEQGADEGYTFTRGIDKERYQARNGLEGPFSTKSGKVVYYDKVEGKYYDPDTDMYIEYDDWQAMNEQGVAEAHGNSKIYDKCWTGYRKVPGKTRGEDGSCEKIKEDEVEEAEVRHDRYMRSHGKKASGGHGSWMFTNKEYGEPGDDETFTAPPGKFSDAAKHAKKWAKEKGHYSVYAMEDGLDEASTADMRAYFAQPSNQNPIKPSTDKRFPSKEAYLRWLQQQKKPTSKDSTVDEDVIYRLDKENPMNDTEVLVIGGAGRYSLDGLRAKARREAEQLAKDLTIDHGGAFRRSAQNVRQLQNTLNTIVAAYDELSQLRKLGGVRSKGIKDEDATVVREGLELMEKWTQKYKNSINCSDPKGFSQKAHCAGKKK